MRMVLPSSEIMIRTAEEVANTLTSMTNSSMTILLPLILLGIILASTRMRKGTWKEAPWTGEYSGTTKFSTMERVLRWEHQLSQPYSYRPRRPSIHRFPVVIWEHPPPKVRPNWLNYNFTLRNYETHKVKSGGKIKCFELNFVIDFVL